MRPIPYAADAQPPKGRAEPSRLGSPTTLGHEGDTRWLVDDHAPQHLERDLFLGHRLQRNIITVFNELDDVARLDAIGSLWTATPVIYTRLGAAAGRTAVSMAIRSLMTNERPLLAGEASLGHNGAELIRWRRLGDAMSPDASGSHLALFNADRIDSLYVFEDAA